MPEVDAFVSGLLSKHGILNYRTLFSQDQYSKKTMPKSNDHIIKPFTLTPHEKSLPLGLTSIAHSTFHTRITTIPADSKLTSLLSLETLKKKTSYDSSSQFNQGVVSPKKAASQTKGGEKRKRRVSQSNSSTDLALLEQGSDSFQKKRVRGSGVGAGSGGRKSDSAADKSGSSASNGSDGRSISLSVLQPKLEAVFKVFWELELDPPSLATPFFGLITRNNCDVLGLPRFFDKILESCTLANISEKLKSVSYLSLESFETDFNLMFSNIFVYFPENSPQFVKAKELQVMFRDQWTHVLLDLNKL